MRFIDILAPLSLEDFRGLIEERPPYKLWRSSANLGGLFGWHELNSVLRQQRTNEIDISILRHCQRVSLRDTTEKTSRKFKTINQLHSEKVAEVLRGGGTVRISRIDEKSNGLEPIVSDIERILGCEASISLYAGFGSAHHALPVHFDRHDVLIIQLEGKKAWEVFGFGNNPYPTQPSEEILSECPSEPTWSGELDKGEMLFLPRGSWHRASVISDIPTLQISIAFHYTMLHELHIWLAKKLAQYPINNRHLLDWSVADDAAFESEVRKALDEIVKHGFLDEYRKDRKLALPKRFSISLPDLGI